jgi:hypothetical protein
MVERFIAAIDRISYEVDGRERLKLARAAAS